MKNDKDDTVTTVEVTFPKSPQLAQIPGSGRARNTLSALSDDIALFRGGKLPFKSVDSGIVLSGPPGTGKTTLMKALAASIGAPLILTDYAQWADDYGANGVIAAIKDVFETARSAAKKHGVCIVGIDEIDSVMGRGTAGHNDSYYRPINNALLRCVDVAERHGVIVIGACNDASKLDAALVRPGRLNRVIEVPLPGIETIPDILRFHLTDKSAKLDLKHIAAQCIGKSGAELEDLVHRAERVARQKKQRLAVEHFREAVDSFFENLDHNDLALRAFNAASHIIAADALGLCEAITVSLHSDDIPRQLSSAWPATRLTRPRAEDIIVMALAGRAAEEVYLKEPTSLSGGDAKSDLAFASKLAFDAVMALGIGKSNNLLWFGSFESNPSAATFRPICDEADEMLKAAYARAMELMSGRESELYAVTQILMRNRVFLPEDIPAARKPLTAPNPVLQKDYNVISISGEPLQPRR